MGKDIPDIKSCRLLSEYSGVPVQRVLLTMGHIAETGDKENLNWPEFREYAHKKYPKILDEDIITIIEDMIERRREEKFNKQRKKKD